jgi:hypothetical protein
MSDTVIDTQPLADDLDANFVRFIEEAEATGCVWTLESEEGFALCPSNHSDAVDVMPFWSQPEFATVHCVDEWSVYQPVPVALTEFLDEWLPGMHDDRLLIGINWNAAMEGDEIEPLDLLEIFEESDGIEPDA